MLTAPPLAETSTLIKVATQGSQLVCVTAGFAAHSESLGICPKSRR